MSVGQQISKQREDFARARSQIKTARSKIPKVSERQLRQGSGSPLMGRLQRRQITKKREQVMKAEKELTRKQTEFEQQVISKAPQYADPEVKSRLIRRARDQLRNEVEVLKKRMKGKSGDARDEIQKEINVYLKLLAGKKSPYGLSDEQLLVLGSTGNIGAAKKAGKRIAKKGDEGFFIDVDTGLGYSAIAPLKPSDKFIPYSISDLEKGTQEITGYQFKSPVTNITYVTDKKEKLTTVISPAGIERNPSAKDRLEYSTMQKNRELALKQSSKMQSIDPYVQRDMETRGTVFPRGEYLLEKSLRRLDVPLIGGISIVRPTLTQPLPLRLDSPLSFRNTLARVTPQPIATTSPTRIINAQSSIPSSDVIDTTRETQLKSLLVGEPKTVVTFKPSQVVDTALWFAPYGVGVARASLFGLSYVERAKRANIQGKPYLQFMKERPLETAGVVLLGGLGVYRGFQSLKVPVAVRIRAGSQGEAIAGVGIIQTRGSKILRDWGLPKLASKQEIPFAFVEKEVGKGFELTAGKGKQLFSEGQFGTESISKMLGKSTFRDSVITREAAISRAKGEFLGTRGSSIRFGDVTLSGGTIFQVGAKKGLPFEAVIKDVPKTSQTSWQNTLQKLKNQKERIGGIVEKAVSETSILKIKPIVKTGTVGSPKIIKSESKVFDVKSSPSVTSGAIEETTRESVKDKSLLGFDIRGSEDVKERIKQRDRVDELQDELQQEQGRNLLSNKVFTSTRTNLRTGLGLRDVMAQDEMIELRKQTTTISTPQQLTARVLKPSFGWGRSKTQSEKSKGNIIVKGFDVYIRRKGKWIKISRKALTKSKALKLGSERVKETLAASFKIMETPQKVTIKRKGFFTPSTNTFRSYKIVKGRKVPLTDTFIQRRGKRLSSSSEVREIQGRRKTKKVRWV